MSKYKIPPNGSFSLTNVERGGLIGVQRAVFWGGGLEREKGTKRQKQRERRKKREREKKGYDVMRIDCVSG